MSDVTIRDAVRSDAADLAILDNIAGHGISQWFWQAEVNQGRAEDAYSCGRERMMADDAFYGWSNARLAVRGDEVVGSCTSYVMPAPDLDEAEESAGAFAPVFDLFATLEGNWFIDSLATYPQARGLGIGRTLVEDAVQRGRSRGFESVSLVMEDANTTARNLYNSFGFVEKDRRDFISFNGRSKSKNWLLLTAPL